MAADRWIGQRDRKADIYPKSCATNFNSSVRNSIGNETKVSDGKESDPFKGTIARSSLSPSSSRRRGISLLSHLNKYTLRTEIAQMLWQVSEKIERCLGDRSSISPHSVTLSRIKAGYAVQNKARSTPRMHPKVTRWHGKNGNRFYVPSNPQAGIPQNSRRSSDTASTVSGASTRPIQSSRLCRSVHIAIRCPINCRCSCDPSPKPHRLREQRT